MEAIIASRGRAISACAAPARRKFAEIDRGYRDRFAALWRDRFQADELLGRKALPKSAAAVQAPEEKRLWKKLRLIAALPERDQRAVLRLIDSAAIAQQVRRSA